MSERSEKAVELFKSGYNCSQAVFAAYADLFGFDEDTALKVSAGLGGGGGRSRAGIRGCGVRRGMKYGATDGDDTEGKKLCYYKVQEFIAEFKKVNPSIVCRELLGLSKGENSQPKPDERNEHYYKKRPCVQLVEDSALALEKILF